MIVKSPVVHSDPDIPSGTPVFVGTRVYVLSSPRTLDGKVLGLRAALSEMVGQGMGSVVSCIPGPRLPLTPSVRRACWSVRRRDRQCVGQELLLS